MIAALGALGIGRCHLATHATGGIIAAETMPNGRLVTVPGIGHSMNLEEPALDAGYLGGFLGGVPV